MTQDIAIAHWALPAFGGGEQVAFELARTFDAPLYVGDRNPRIEPDDIDVRHLFDDRRTVKALATRDLPALSQFALVAGWSTAHRLREYDTIITNGNEPLFYVPADGQTWIHYAHHTGRTATDLLHTLEDIHGGIRSRVTKPLDYWMKFWQRHSCQLQAQKPDRIVCNSDVIRDRVHTYWGVPLDNLSVVYPPVDTDGLRPDVASTRDYYLTLGRLTRAKHVDTILDAFDGLDAELLVAGDGPQREPLMDAAPDNVDFLGYVDDDRKRRLLSEATAFIFAAVREDFGIAPVEALASGTPVIGVDEEFTRYQIHDGKNGILFDRTPGALRNAVAIFEDAGVAWSPTEIAADADRFSQSRFRQEIRGVVADVVAEKQRRRTPAYYPVRDPSQDRVEQRVTSGGDQ